MHESTSKYLSNKPPHIHGNIHVCLNQLCKKIAIFFISFCLLKTALTALNQKCILSRKASVGIYSGCDTLSLKIDLV